MIQFRLQAEYGVETALDTLPFSYARWVVGEPDAVRNGYWASSGMRRVADESEWAVVLFESEWGMNFVVEKNPRLTFTDVAPAGAQAASWT